jgi:hypothetical protein
MASGRAADREDPNNSKRRAARSLDRGPISALHQGQRSDAPHQRAGHMTAPDHFAETLLTSFAGGGRPHMNFATSPNGPSPDNGRAPCKFAVGRADNRPAKLAVGSGSAGSRTKIASGQGVQNRRYNRHWG